MAAAKKKAKPATKKAEPAKKKAKPATKKAEPAKKKAEPAKKKTERAKKAPTPKPTPKAKAATAKRTPARRASSTTAVLALSADPRARDAAIAVALAALPDAGRRDVVSEWTARIAAGDPTLVTHLLAMFELSALGASDANELTPFIDPLREVGGMPEVFAHVEHAMASERPAVREAVCARWLADARAQAVFDSSQIDKLVRCAVAIAEGLDDSPDRRAAMLALSRMTHPGGRHALMHAIHHAGAKSHPGYLESLYAGLVTIGAPDLVPFLIERLFEEVSDYNAIISAVAKVFDNFAHRHVLTALAARAGELGAIRAATLYADAVAFRGKASGRLVELARVVLAWSPSSNDDARRLRYLFELALDAALSLGRTDDAGTFLARVRELPDAPYSDYYVLARNARTPTLLDGPRIRDYLKTM